MTRKIIHIDMDAFFASVEQRDNPELRSRPVIVGGNPNSRGVVAAASYEARQFGVHSAMPCSQAYRKCPQAVFVKPRFEAYREVSQQIHVIFAQYSDLIEPLSLDEAYLDVTHNKVNNPSAIRIAQAICQQIHQDTGLTASAGVSYNKFIAKTASEDYAKRQKEAVNTSLFKADLVITTAMVPGRKSPVLITEEQVNQMKNGSVIIDLAAAQGGNCEISIMNKTIIHKGVKVIGTTISPESVSTNASDLYAKNMYNFIMHLTEENKLKWDLEEEITDETLIVHNGKIRKNGKTE